MIPRLAGVVLMALALGACDTISNILDEEDDDPFEGQRVSVLALDPVPEADPHIQDLIVRLPPPRATAHWPQLGGFPDHAMHHLLTVGPLEKIWSAGIGAGSSDEFQLAAIPVVANERIYAMDAEGQVSSFAVADGEELWQIQSVREDEEEDALGGGLAFYRGRLFVTTGAGEVLALDSADGEVIWRKRVGAPLRAAPTVSNGRLFTVSNDNKLFALDVDDGRELWTHQGISETARLFGAASPAVAEDIVIAAYSSGEIFALQVENGRTVWSDTLSIAGRVSTLGSLSDINGSPVVDQGQVLALSHAGRLVAIDLRRGNRLWEQELAGTQMPWVAGDFLFVMTVNSEVLCLSRRDGRIRWVRPLTRFEDPEDRTGEMFWSGPLLVSDRLIVTSSRGDALSISPYTGDILGRIEFPDGVELAPIVADGTVYVLTNDGDIVALK